jgi:Conserved hypothetical ATP binding protein
MIILFLIVQASRKLSCLYFQSQVFTGQIELYTHHPFLPTLVQNLSRMGIRTCAVYLLESQFMEDRYKFFRCGSNLIVIFVKLTTRSDVLTPLQLLLVLAPLCHLCR